MSKKKNPRAKAEKPVQSEQAIVIDGKNARDEPSEEDARRLEISRQEAKRQATANIELIDRDAVVFRSKAAKRPVPGLPIDVEFVGINPEDWRDVPDDEPADDALDEVTPAAPWLISMLGFDPDNEDYSTDTSAVFAALKTPKHGIEFAAKRLAAVTSSLETFRAFLVEDRDNAARHPDHADNWRGIAEDRWDMARELARKLGGLPPRPLPVVNSEATFKSAIDLLLVWSWELPPSSSQLPPESNAPTQAVKGKPGRPGYPLEALELALKLRAEDPRMKVAAIRNACLKQFSKDDLPPDVESFRRWMNRKRANRAK